MATEVTCPDCGGIIGGDPSDTRPPCTCSPSLTMDDTEVEAQPALAADAPPAPVPLAKPAKICCQCGKDVTNQKRAKDARGYWCYECHRNDLRRERAGQKPRARCPQCGRLVPAETITSYHGITLCARCLREQEDLPKHLQLKYKNKLATDDPVEKLRKEKLRIYILAGVFGLLLLIIVLSHFL